MGGPFFFFKVVNHAFKWATQELLRSNPEVIQGHLSRPLSRSLSQDGQALLAFCPVFLTIGYHCGCS
jgi:hypothetical protein